MVSCSIRNCKIKSEKGSNIRFFTLPRDKSMADQWLRLCKPKTSMKHGRVCSIHFAPSDYGNVSLKYRLLNIPTPKSIRNLKPEAVPTLYIDDSNVQIQPTKLISEPLTMKPESCETLSTDGTKSSDLNSDQYSKTFTRLVFVDTFDVQKSVEETTLPVKSEYDHSYCQSKTSVTPPFRSVDTLTSQTLPNEVVASSGTVMERGNDMSLSTAEIRKLQKTAKEYHILKNNLRGMFTPGQIRCLMKRDKRRVKWNTEDITGAFTLLRSIGPKAYYYLKATVGIPLPSFSTLRRWNTSTNE